MEGKSDVKTIKHKSFFLSIILFLQGEYDRLYDRPSSAYAERDYERRMPLPPLPPLSSRERDYLPPLPPRSRAEMYGAMESASRYVYWLAGISIDCQVCLLTSRYVYWLSSYVYNCLVKINKIKKLFDIHRFFSY